jgi:acyl CoA:acetate/3-ketoacid CoA transferase beta subunit
VGSGVGARRAAAAGPAATRYHRSGVVISNLGVFDFDTPDQVMRIPSLHPPLTHDAMVCII